MIAPLLFVIGMAIVLLLLLILRVLIGVTWAIGHVFVGVLGLGLAFVGGAFLLVFGLLAVHLLLPILLLVGLIWLLRRAARPAPLRLEHHPG